MGKDAGGWGCPGPWVSRLASVCQEKNWLENLVNQRNQEFSSTTQGLEKLAAL